MIGYRRFDSLRSLRAGPFDSLRSLRAGTILVVAIALASSPAVNAAVTVTAASGEENPRTTWSTRYQDSRQGPEETERFSQTYKVGADGALDLQNLAGDVIVMGGRSNDIQIQAVKRARHRDSGEARRVLGLLRIEVSQVGGRVEVRTVFPRVNGRGLSASVDYTISVPATIAVNLKTIAGNVSVTGVRGEVRADSTSGNVTLTSTPNVAVAKTVSGDVIAKDIGATTLTLSTISGSVIASALKVRTLDAGTVSGDIRLTNVQVERVQAKSMSGNIEFDAPLARGGRYEFNAHSGNVRLMLSQTSGFELDASTFSGSIRSDFPITLRSTSSASSTSERNGRRVASINRSIRGTFGDANATLAVRSFSGTVVITRK